MTAQMAASTEGLIDLDKLTAWLDEHVPEVGSGPLSANLIHGGTSNVIIALDRGGEPVVLRRPPAVPPPNSEKSILREGRVLQALNATDVPHPHCFAVCSDTSVIGGPFYVMQRIDGWSGELHDDRILNPAPFDAPPYMYRVPFAVVDALVALANVDHEAIGLGDYGKPDNFLQRQVDRWDRQMKSYAQMYDFPMRDLPGYDETAAWLRANVPEGSEIGLMHGDVSTTNMMFSAEPPARVIALIDWELSTIGDPLIDLAWFCNGLADEQTPGVAPAGSLFEYENLPTRQEMARYYAGGTGRDISQFDYYLVLAMFKGGCILEYKVAQAARGHLSAEIGEFFSRMVLESFAHAAAKIRRMG
jgi:aminoglycoside phosphotransferase (APT) family kinase protein